uniref:Uncharacterized protein n=1 Tax=Tanacetum cinerariifolium TaxID=118510 RepID=A0A6L2J4G1_TANCI|nr:hypothetical protein [Tanacetum cinerariifolium]
MTKGNKKQYTADVRVVNYLLQAIPNDIYNSVDACKNAKEMLERIKRLMHGSEITTHVRHSRLMDKFDKFAAKEGEYFDSVHERLTTLVNIMDRNNVRLIPVAINMKFLNCLQPEMSKYVTMVCHNQTGSAVFYDVLYDQIVELTYKPRMQVMVEMLTRMQGEIELKGLIHKMKRTNVVSYEDEARSNLSNEENDFMLDTSYGEELEELTTTVMLMVRIQPGDKNAEAVPSHDATIVSQVHASSKVHEQVSHRKRKMITQTTDGDQIDSNIIFDDPFVENNGGTSEHDSIAHDEYREIQMLAYNVQREAKNQKHLNNEHKQQKDLLQREIKTFKDQSIQMIHMLGKKLNKIYDHFLKVGLGYTNLECLKKAIAAQPKMYDGELIHSNKLVIHSIDSEETLEDAEESQNKMRHKMVQIDYEKFNALYETFVPHQELFSE